MRLGSQGRCSTNRVKKKEQAVTVQERNAVGKGGSTVKGEGVSRSLGGRQTKKTDQSQLWNRRQGRRALGKGGGGKKERGGSRMSVLIVRCAGGVGVGETTQKRRDVGQRKKV